MSNETYTCGICEEFQTQHWDEFQAHRTQEILGLIEENRGPEGLNLSGNDLSEIDLSSATIKAELEKTRERTTDKTPIWFSEETGGINLQEAILQNANLRKAKLWGANLQEANLRFASLQGAFLEDANLQRAKLWYAELQKTNLVGANLQKVELQHAKLQEANLTLADLQEAKLRGANLQEAVLWNAKLQRAELAGTNLHWVNLRTAKLEGTFFSGVRLDHTEMDRAALGTDIGEESAGDYYAARDAYLRLKQNFDDLGDYTASSWAYCKERRMEKKSKAPWRCRRYYGCEEPFPRPVRELFSRLWPNIREYGLLPRRSPLVWWFCVKYMLKWLADWFVELLCDYGECFWQVLLWMFVSLFGFATYYGRIGGVWLVESNGAAKVATSFWHYLVYSAGAFTTTGFARFQPADDWVRMVTAIQAIVGIFLAGLLGFVAGNRIRRS